MPDNTRCPRCSEVGRVRIEHVIQGGHSYRVFQCNACGHDWRVLETGEHVPATEPAERVDHSRPHGESSQRRDRR